MGAEGSGGRRGRFWRAAFAADSGPGNEGGDEADARSQPDRSAEGSGVDANEVTSKRRISGAQREAFANFVTAEASALEGAAAAAAAAAAEAPAPARVPAAVAGA